MSDNKRDLSETHFNGFKSSDIEQTTQESNEIEFDQDTNEKFTSEQIDEFNDTDTAQIEDSEQVEDEPKPRSTKLQKFVYTIIALTLVGGIFVGSKFIKDKNNNPDIMPQNPIEETAPAPTQTTQEVNEITPDTSVEIEPTESVEKIPTVEELEIDASLIDNPEALMQRYDAELKTIWFNIGAGQEKAQIALDATEPIKEMAKKEAEKYDQLFIEAIFIKEWQSEPSLVEMVNRMKEIHSSTLYANYLTAFPEYDSKDKEAYRREANFQKVISSERAVVSGVEQITIRAVVNDSDNADKNRVGSELGGGVTGEDNTVVVTYKKYGDQLKVSHIRFVR